MLGRNGEPMPSFFRTPLEGHNLPTGVFRMKRVLSPRLATLVLAILCASLPTAIAQQKGAPPLKVTCDRADAIYRVGDTATFNIEALEDVEFTYVVSKDGFKTVNKGTGKLSKGTPLGIGTKLTEPGFL